MQILIAISAQATKEYALECALKRMREEWANVRLELVPYKDTGVHVLTAAVVDELNVLLDEHLIKMISIKGSPFQAPFAKEIAEWDALLVP